MAQKLRLSICMPTYNFGAYIGQTLDSILPQMTSEIELIIVDGGSNDNTAEIVNSYLCNSNAKIVYHQLASKGGIDQDMALSVSLAQGEYVWLFSSDDLMKEGAIKKVLKEIQSQQDVYLCQYELCGLDIKRIIRTSHSFFKCQESYYNISKTNERKKYFKNAWNTEPFFSFMSMIIIKRNKWNESNVPDIFYGSCFAHAYRILSSFKSGLTIKVLTDSYLFKRTGNDSFLGKGHVHRVGISIYGYLNIVESIFGKASFEFDCIRRVLRNEYKLREFLLVKQKAKNKQELQKLKHMFQLIYKKTGLIGSFKYLILCTFNITGINILRSCYGSFKTTFSRPIFKTLFKTKTHL